MKLLSRLVLLLLLARLALSVHAWFVWSPEAPSYVLAAEARAEPLLARFRDGFEHDAIRAEHPEQRPRHPPGAGAALGAEPTADDPAR